MEIRRIIEEVNSKYPDQPIHDGEIYPTNTVPILLAKRTEIIPEVAAWGFPKFKGNGVIINARSETASEKKTFRDSLLFRRCAVPSTGFYEWDSQKKKRLFRFPGEQTLYMGGFYKEFQGERRYVILTTAANNSVSNIHDRMPVVLPRDKLQEWIFNTDTALNYIQTKMPELINTE